MISWWKLAEHKTALTGVDHVVVEKPHGISISTAAMAAICGLKALTEELYDQTRKEIEATCPEAVGEASDEAEGRSGRLIWCSGPGQRI